MKPRCGILLLAAGSSGRMGTPKQLLKFGKTTLLQHLVDEATVVPGQPLVVVLGASSEEIRKQLDLDKIVIVTNEHYQDGMASSIVCGMQYVIENSSTDAVIVMTCDQPFVTTALLHSLIDQQAATGKPIVASSYDQTIGSPALFHASVFPELLELTGDRGAKKIIESRPDRVALVDFPRGAQDIDTALDYSALFPGV